VQIRETGDDTTANEPGMEFAIVPHGNLIANEPVMVFAIG
jgi:hypothetical protein